MADVNTMKLEIEEKLKEVSQQVDNKKADEYTKRINLLEREQIIMTQVLEYSMINEKMSYFNRLFVFFSNIF